MSRSSFGWIAVVVCVVLCSRLSADEEKKTAPADTNSSTEVLALKPTQTFALSYFGIYSAAPLSSPLRGGTINTTTLNYDDTAPQNLSNQLKLDYNITDRFFVGAVANFFLTPVPGQTFVTMNDSGIRVGDRKLIHTDNVNLLADFRVMAPLRPSYRADDEQLNLQSLQILTYTVPKTKLTLGVLGFHYFQLYGSGVPANTPSDPKDPRDLTMYFAPNASYQFTRTLAATLYYEIYPYHVLNASWTTLGADPADIAPGIEWDITPSVSINPQILIYPSKLSLSTLSPVVYINAKFL